MFKKLRNFWRGFINVVCWKLTIPVYEGSLKYREYVENLDMNTITEKEISGMLKKIPRLKGKSKLRFGLADFIFHFK